MSRRYLRGLERILTISDPHDRGYAFQGFVADLFTAVDFEVTPNAGAARPRQTDLIARRGDEAYLIEAKWESTKAGSPEVDALHSRLRRTSADLVGVFFAYGGFNDNALDVVLQERSRPVLLFDRDAIEELDVRPKELLRLIDLKRTTLVDRGEVHAGGSGKTRFHNLGLPASTAQFLHPDGSRTPTYASGGEYNKLVFATNLVDVDWTTSLGRGVTLDLPLGVHAVQELVVVFKDLLEMGWTARRSYKIERAPRWSIQQADTNWHGDGTREFIAALKGWKGRYAGIGEARLHHTEEFVYTDQCRYGFFTLTGQVSADPRRIVLRSVLSFQLYGIPLDQEMIRRLARRFDDQAVFRPLDGEARKFRHLRDEAPKRITPLCLVVDKVDGEEWAVGIVIKNFYKNRRRTMAAEARESLPWRIYDTDVLICDLAEWHLVDGPKTRYYLQALEWADTSESTVVRPVANWENAGRRTSRISQQPRSMRLGPTGKSRSRVTEVSPPSCTAEAMTAR